MHLRTTPPRRRAGVLVALAALAACTDAPPTTAPTASPNAPALNAAATSAQAFNFRASAAHASDAGGETYVNAGEDGYPTTRDGRTFGWSRSGSSLQGLNLGGMADRRLAGVAEVENADTAAFRVDLPAPGTYRIRLAIGHAYAGTRPRVRLLDGAAGFAQLSVTTTEWPWGVLSMQYMDATGTRMPTEEWPTANQPITHTFATSSFVIVLGDPGGVNSDKTALAHVSIERVGPAPATGSLADAYASGDPVELASAVAADRCASVSGARRDEGARLEISNCLNGTTAAAAQQTFRWSSATGELKVYDGTTDVKCVDAFGGGLQPGDWVGTWGCHGGNNQKWEPTPDGTGIRAVGSNVCLEVPGGDTPAGTAAGTGLSIWTCHGGINQRWSARRITGGTADPTSPEKVRALVGPFASVSDVRALGGAFTRYEDDFVTYSERHWSEHGANWEAGNYYDRAKIYYVWWARTGNQVYRDRADAMALDYRRNYVEAHNYGVSAHWSKIEGVALHYLVTGDEASRVAVGRMADNFAVPYYMGQIGDTRAEMENRVQARTLTAFVVANRVGAPRGDYPADKPTWDGLAREALTKILSTQSADGAYRFQQGNQCGHNKPFMVGLLNDALIQYYEKFEADPRILPAVRKSLDYMWANDWREAEQGFVYLGGPCGGDVGPGQPDLNNLISDGFGWVYKQTGDATYRSRGDAVFAGGVNGAYLYGSKQFNEEYTFSYKYPAYTR